MPRVFQRVAAEEINFLIRLCKCLWMDRYNESKRNFGRAATEKRDKEGMLQ